MDHACPHCHELMRTDAVTGQPPTMCPRCGGNIATSASQARAAAEPTSLGASGTTPAARSLATFLQSNSAGAGANTAGSPQAGKSASAHDPGRREAVMSASEPTLEIDEIADSDEGADSTPADAPLELDSGEASTPPTRARPTDEKASTASDVVDSTANEATSPQGAAFAAAANAVPALTTTPKAMATPSFTHAARESAAPLRTARWQWAALAGLSLLLVLQILLADRARLAADAQWRPLLASLCGVFGCSLPTWREPDAFTMLSRDVRPVKGSAGALLVEATFRNDARWSQAWPVMRLSLSDADGRIVAARAFLPSEYLEATATQTVLAPGQSAQIMLQVREPEASVVAFSFDFD